jgi:tRNA(Ile)-lysidine synthase TilS/MesJ
MRQILSYVRRAVDDFNMIRSGDEIAVGLSGGKDSITTLLALSNLKRFYPKSFKLIAITLDMGIEGFNTEALRKICEENKIPYIVEKTHIAEIVFNIRKEKNPCSLCANLRRGILYDTAVKNSCNKVALGHHMDDVMETLFMSLIYEGRIHTFSPVTYLSRKIIEIIRPLIYTPEEKIKSFIKENNIVPVKNTCPANGETKRQYMKDLIHKIDKENYKAKESIFGAIKRSREWSNLLEVQTNEKDNDINYINMDD